MPSAFHLACTSDPEHPLVPGRIPSSDFICLDLDLLGADQDDRSAVEHLKRSTIGGGINQRKEFRIKWIEDIRINEAHNIACCFLEPLGREAFQG